MCADCGCGKTDVNPGVRYAPVSASTSRVEVLRRLLSENDTAAEHNRCHFDANHVLAVNLMSSPGAGKTALLEASIDALSDEYRIAVIVGDLETENDARRIRAKGVPVVQITTGSACHLDASMVHDAWHRLPHDRVDILFIENVGNLVCPASFDLGQHHDIVLLSVTEGDDKPAKYPVMFRAADLLLITKVDLLPYLDDFDESRARRFMHQIAGHAPVLSISARKDMGMDEWLAWLRRMHAARGRFRQEAR
ncbi:hydrogenase nickel incorporation protein HypB [Massilia niastensis]|uniref:hydrogenase nickel incorporation protein HypB n=1 Tax=Massilia niastensis TaxID=544911 RepID=UPI00037B0033|nr:hydrogenase nickel incorporation protein HypB [Massilia niastensis]